MVAGNFCDCGQWDCDGDARRVRAGSRLRNSPDGAIILAEAAARAALRTACRQYLAVPLPTTPEAVARVDLRARDLAGRLQAYLDEDAE